MACFDEDVVACFDESVLACLDKNNKDDLVDIFSIRTAWNIFLGKPWVGNFYSIFVVCIKLFGVRPIPTSFIAVTIQIR